MASFSRIEITVIGDIFLNIYGMTSEMQFSDSEF